MLVSIYRVIKFASQDFWRNVWLSFATVLMLVLTLFSINFLVAMNKLSEITIAAIESRIDVSVYLRKNLTVEEIQKVKQDLKTLPSIQEISAITAEEALENFLARHKNDEDIVASIQELDENPLGPSLIIKAANAEQYPAILNELNSSRYEQYIEDKDFDDHQALISRITRTKNKVGQAAGVMTLLFVLIASLIVYNAIRVNIYTHKNELEVMKLVGATNWFIRAPFVFEAIMYSVVGLALTMVILYPILYFLQPYLTGFFTGQNINIIQYFVANALMIFGLQFIGVTFINILSTSLALGKYLKV